MNLASGIGIGLIAGACAGKMGRHIIEHEVRALIRDVKWDMHTGEYRTLHDVIAYYDTYPSVYRRFQDIYYSGYRTITDIRYIPANIRGFIHRGRYGWAEKDVWNVDMHIVDVLVGMLEHYKDHTMGYPADTTEDAWNARIDEILWGLRQYQLYWNTNGTTRPEDYQQATEDALAALKRSFELLADDLPGIWI